METLNPWRSKAQRHKRLLWEIAALAVILRLIGLAFAHVGTLDQDAYEWGEIARNLLNGAGHSFNLYGDLPTGPSAFAPPLYSYLLAGYAWIFGPRLWVLAVFQALAGGFTCWILGWIGTALFSRKIGLIAAAIFAVYPEAIFASQKFVPEPWLLLFELLFLLCAIQYLRQGKRVWIFAAGVLAGVAALAKESALMYPALLLAWIWLVRKASRRLMVDSLLLVIVATAVIAPWTLRNYTVFGTLVPIRTGFWYNAWRGNHPGATGTARTREGVNVYYAMDSTYRADVDAHATGNEVQRDWVYREATLQFVRQHPGQYTQLCLKRFSYLWGRDPTHPNTGSVLYWGPWIVLLIFAVIGAVFTRSHWRDYSFWYLLFISTTLVYSLTMVMPRYRLPLLPGLMLLAGEGVEATWNLWRDRKSIKNGIIR